MKKLLSALLVLMLIVTVIPAASAENPSAVLEVFNVSEYVSLRKTPSTSADRVAKVYKGELVYFYAEPDGSAESFYQVEYDGKVGYIHKDYAKVS